MSFAETAFALAEEEASDDSVLGVAMLIMEVRERDNDITSWYTYCTDKRQWVQDAALREGQLAIGFIEDEEGADAD